MTGLLTVTASAAKTSLTAVAISANPSKDAEPKVPLRLTLAALGRWLDHAAPGDVLEYHRGMLAVDAYSGAKRMTDEDRAELIRVRDFTLWAAEEGLIHLIQHREGVEDFSYRLIVRPRTRKTKDLRASALIKGGAR